MEHLEYTVESLGKDARGQDIEICISEIHRFGTDAFLLADFAGARHKDTCVDLCTGSGIVALLLEKFYAPKAIAAVEIQQEAHELLKLSLERSRITNISPVLADLRQWTSPGEADLITCNPPYKVNDTGAKNKTEAASIARHELMCTIEDVCEAAKRSLRFGGRLCVCNRPQRLGSIFRAMRESGIEPKRLRTVHKNPGSQPWLVLVEGVKGGKEYMTIEPPLFVRSADGGVSEEMQRIYRQK